MEASKKNNSQYSKHLKENAHDLRYKMTKAEACLWKYALGRKQLSGYTFNRQRPILNFIADFFCKELNLVIEVDGYSHLLEEVIEKDKIKQEVLEKAGYTVLRFTDNEVLTQVTRVRQVIWDTIDVLKNNPPPAPSGGGHVGQSLASSIYSQTKDSYLLKNVSAIETKELKNDLWLVLTGIDNIPPHIALINSGKYYSVTARKVKVGEPIENFLKAISRNTLPTIFVKINMSQPSKALWETLNDIFSKYPTLGNGEHTCHWPIRDFFSLVSSADFKKANLVFDLLEELQAKNMLLECRSIYIDGGRQEIELPKYTLGHIREKINSILKVNE